MRTTQCNLESECKPRICCQTETNQLYHKFHVKVTLKFVFCLAVKVVGHVHYRRGILCQNLTKFRTASASIIYPDVHSSLSWQSMKQVTLKGRRQNCKTTRRHDPEDSSHHVKFITKSSLLILHKEIVSVFRKDHTKRIKCVRRCRFVPC
jgi:hypothetical protein